MTDFLLIGIFTGAAYALMAVGFVLVYRGTRVFNLAHGEIGGFGLYVAWSVLDRVPVLVASLIGIVVAAGVAVLLEATLVRRVARRNPLAALASTLGAGLTLAWAEALIWSPTIKTYPSPVGGGALEIGSVTITAPRIAALIVAVIVAIGLAIFLRRTRFGLAVSATTSDDALAQLSGVNTRRTRRFIWALGGALSGTAAILLASVYTFHPISSTFILVKAMAAALIGGLLSLTGAFIGGLVIGIAEALVISQTSMAGMVDAVVFGLILAVLLLRPQGDLGAQST